MMMYSEIPHPELMVAVNDGADNDELGTYIPSMSKINSAFISQILKEACARREHHLFSQLPSSSNK